MKRQAVSCILFEEDCAEWPKTKTKEVKLVYIVQDFLLSLITSSIQAYYISRIPSPVPRLVRF